MSETCRLRRGERYAVCDDENLRARDEGRGDGSCVTPVVLTDAGALNPVFRKTASCETKSAGNCI